MKNPIRYDVVEHTPTGEYLVYEVWPAEIDGEPAEESILISSHKTIDDVKAEIARLKWVDGVMKEIGHKPGVRP